MNLLASTLYDPAGAVTKSTASLLAMTAFDTTNLRLAITVPSHGMVRFRIRCTLGGSTTFPTILLGVMDGSTILGRVAPVQTLGNTAVSTAFVTCDAEFTVTGLTPGALNVDAAYGVETIVISTNIKYGGPNDTTGNNAYGGFVFEAWDPAPNPANFGLLSIDSNGRIDVIKIAGTTQTARDIGSSVLLSSGTGTGQLDFSSGIVKANVTQFGGSNGTFASGRPEVNNTHWNGTAVATPDTAGYPKVTLKVGTGTGEIFLVSGGTLVASMNSGVIGNSQVASGTLSETKFSQEISCRPIRVSTATAGAATTITLDASASATDDIYKGCPIYIYSGTGANQVRTITAYNGTTKVATVDRAWATNPSVTSNFSILPAVVPALNASLQVAADVVALSGDSAAADNAEAFFDGTGYAGTNNVIPAVTSTGAIGTGGIAAASFAAGAINAAAIADGAIDAATFAAGAIDAAAIAANAIGASELAADAVAEIAAAVAAAIPDVLVSTTIATLASQLQFTLTAGSADDKAYNACLAIITDASTAVQKAVAPILQYTGSTKTVRLAFDPAVFTMAASDLITIVAAAEHPEVHCDLSVKSTEGLAAQVNVWMTVAGRLVPVASLDASASCSVVVSEHDTGTTHFTAAGAAADLRSSRFEYEQATPNFTDDRQYSAVASVTLNSQTFSTTHNNIVVG